MISCGLFFFFFVLSFKVCFLIVDIVIFLVRIKDIFFIGKGDWGYECRKNERSMLMRFVVI